MQDQIRIFALCAFSVVSTAFLLRDNGHFSCRSESMDGLGDVSSGGDDDHD